MSERAKQNILSRLRQRPHPGERTQTASPPRFTRPQTSLEQLADKLKNNRFEVLHVNQAGLTGQFRNIAQKGLAQWCIGEYPECPAVTKALAQCPEIKLTAYNEPFEQLKDKLFNDIDVGLSVCNGAIAETGTLILSPDSQQPRSLSLIPPVHVIVLFQPVIYENLSQYLDQIDTKTFVTRSNSVLISSPSKTADIQQTLAYGAHGPKRVIVLVLQ